MVLLKFSLQKNQISIPTKSSTPTLTTPKHIRRAWSFYKGFLYETTGHRGQSTLRKVELETGKVLTICRLVRYWYFGEGMTILLTAKSSG